MSEFGNQSPPLARLDPPAPPIRPGDLPRKPSSWPAVIGVIAIVVGALGVLMYGWGVIAPFLMPRWKWLATVSGAGTTEAIGIWKIPLAIVDGLVCLVTILLVFGGLDLCRRRARGAKRIWAWAVAKLVLTIPLVVVTVGMQNDQLKAMAAGGQMSAAMPPAFGPVMIAVTALFSLCWYAVFPVFLLIWFTRPGIKKQVASWRSSPVS